jgi:hypothetical protein
LVVDWRRVLSNTIADRGRGLGLAHRLAPGEGARAHPDEARWRAAWDLKDAQLRVHGPMRRQL